MATLCITRWVACFAVILLGVFALVLRASAAGGYINVTDAGAPSSITCTLAQAIASANAANGVVAAKIGSATTNVGTCSGALSGLNEINLSGLSTTTITLTTIDNYWYGPNALPPIASQILLSGGGKTLLAQHVGDPTPATSNAFRFFYLSGGMELPAGTLTLTDVVLRGGYAKGGDSQYGGSGAGMGGAIFNQGSLTLISVTLINNIAQGGSINLNPNSDGGGGIGQDAQGPAGGGFGGSLGTVLYGGVGGSGSYGYGGGGGGGGFLFGDNGVPADGFMGADGGGRSALAGNGGKPLASAGGGIGGDGGGGGLSEGYGVVGGSGGSFGGGGSGLPSETNDGGGGGGVGGGGGLGDDGGGGGGFGGGGGYGYAGGNGGFGGGGGAGYSSVYGGLGGFGGGTDSSGFAAGGSGMGGAIFNHTGTVHLLNVTATGNAARGGSNASANGFGSGLGAVLFNLNGAVSIDFSTLAGNAVAGNNAQADTKGPEDGTVYSLAFGNKIQDSSASSASLSMNNSIVFGTQADAGNKDDVSVNVVNGTNTNTCAITYIGKNFIGHSYAVRAVTRSGPLPSSADPLVGALSYYPSYVNANRTPVLPIGANSPAYNTAPSCFESDGTTTLTIDIRAVPRPQFGQCDVGSYEYDGDYIFADGFQSRL